jgi:hypothetical protein
MTPLPMLIFPEIGRNICIDSLMMTGLKVDGILGWHGIVGAQDISWGYALVIVVSKLGY